MLQFDLTHRICIIALAIVYMCEHFQRLTVFIVNRASTNQCSSHVENSTVGFECENISFCCSSVNVYALMNKDV